MLGVLLAATPASAEVALPEANRAEPIVIAAEAANHWRQGSYELWLLRGNCRISQGAASAKGQEAVVWIDQADTVSRQASKVIAYLEGDVAVEQGPGHTAAKLTDKTWLGRYHTPGQVQVYAARVAGQPDVMPAIYQRAVARRDPAPADAVCRTQFEQPRPAEPPTALGKGTVPFSLRENRDSPQGENRDSPQSPHDVLPAGARRVRVFPRGDVPVQAQWFPDPAGNQWIAVIESGVNLIVDGLREYGSIDVSADRLVIWTTGVRADLTGQTAQDERIPLEIYLEGNIVFRQGERVIRANRMYYDVPNQVGTVLGAELLTPVRSYEGLLRLRAEVLQQMGHDRFLAQDAFITSSRMGLPGYRLQSGEITFEDIQRPALEPFTGQPLVDPITGQQVIEHERLATASNDFLFVGPVPIFYWPTLATDLNEPTYYIRRARLKNDSVFGTQVLTDWDAYQLLGIRNKPRGTDWDLSLDYLSERGLGHGTTFLYHRDQFLGVPGATAGLLDYWGIKDDGLDNLGGVRRALVPEKSYRYRLFGQHRQQLAGDYQLTAELGWISDRNFLQEYYKREWDELKDETTGVELKQTRDNMSWSLSADVRLNPFFTQTEWLPRVDHFWLGQSLARDTFTWYEHSQAAYARFRTASAPENPKDQPFNWLEWELDPAGNPLRVQGERLVTRQELDWPLQLGPVKVVPYALGELADWGADRTGNDLQRAYWQAGLRASMPMWRADSTIENQLLNVHGLAHKIVFDGEFVFAESNRDLTQLPLYDPLDDDSIEAIRRRFRSVIYNSPPAPFPARFDERLYALRTGMASWVTAPSTEIADDLTALRLGMRQRWQTKRGMPGDRRIVDWIVLDTNMTWFPDDSRDNFGQALGLLDYDFRWHVGDRLTLVSDAVFDFFPQGQHLVTIGGFLSRPPRGNLYLGLRLIEGPTNHLILSTSYSYWMSPKWISSFGTSIDLKSEGNIGQHLSVTRIGESLLISAGFTFDAARNSAGVALAVEPRFLPKGRLGQVSGARIPVAGAFGLE